MSMPMQTEITANAANVTNTTTATSTLGDVNWSGSVDAKDAAAILEYAAATGLGTFGIEITVIDVDSADINKDGDVDAKDAAEILIYSAQQGAMSPEKELYIEGDFRYYLDSSGAVINGYCTLEKAMVDIPDTLGGSPVVGIDDATFKGHQEIQYVQLPNTLQWIGDEAFAETGLTDLIIPESVTSVGEYAFRNSVTGKISFPNGTTMETVNSFAFSGCLMESIEMPNGISAIGEYAFYECAYLEFVVIPYTVKTVGDYAFWTQCLVERTIAYTTSSVGWEEITFGVYAYDEYTTIVTYNHGVEW